MALTQALMATRQSAVITGLLSSFGLTAISHVTSDETGSSRPKPQGRDDLLALYKSDLSTFVKR